MRSFWVFLFCCLLLVPSAAGDSLEELRERLVRLSVTPLEFGGKTVRVLCPIEDADTDLVTCLVLNATGRTIGREFLVAEPRNSAAYVDILDRCVGASSGLVGDDCTYVVDVQVEVAGGYTLLKAFAFERLAP